MEILTAIVPCFNEEAVIPMFYDEIMRVAELMKNEVEFEVEHQVFSKTDPGDMKLDSTGHLILT